MAYASSNMELFLPGLINDYYLAVQVFYDRTNMANTQRITTSAAPVLVAPSSKRLQIMDPSTGNDILATEKTPPTKIKKSNRLLRTAKRAEEAAEKEDLHLEMSYYLSDSKFSLDKEVSRPIPQLTRKRLPIIDPRTGDDILEKKSRKLQDGADRTYNETSSTCDRLVKSNVTPKNTVIYTTLRLFVKLNLDMLTLYHEFSHHLLSREQLMIYGFPEEVPGRPGRAVMRTQNVTKGSTERRCCRCGHAFHILPDGQYVSDTLCRYHAQKQPRFRNGTPNHGDYSCCNGNYMSEGCKVQQYHVTAESALYDVEFVKTKSKKHLNEITTGTVYALDCEMLYTTAGMELAKVGLVGVDGLTVFESFVLPQNQILDYNTAYSGITEKDLKGVSTTLRDVQTYLLKLLNKDSILVGHGLENDLKALRLIHYNIVDTSVVFPHKHSIYHKKSLKSITREILKKDIQMSSKGHNCIEDARACMELMLHKIHSDIEARQKIAEDKNENSILQNIILPADLNTTATKYTEYQPTSSYSCNFACYSNSRYASNYLMELQ